MADIIGRRWAFNLTLFLNGIFILSAGGSNNVITYGAMFGMTGFASGGNVPVTATMFLELVPTTGYFLLTILSAWWSVGAVLSAVSNVTIACDHLWMVANEMGIAWGFISKYSCSTDESVVCLGAHNMGWLYTLCTLGTIVLFLSIARLFIFRIPESPYYLLAHARDADAIAVVQYIAQKSNKPCTVTLEMLEQINSDYGHSSRKQPLCTKTEMFLRPFKQLSINSLRPLFGTPKLILQTSLFTWLWAAVGIAYPLYTVFLPLYLSAKNATLDSGDSISATYREYCYIAACTIPSPVLAGFVIETRLGRRYALGISALVTGLFLYVSRLAETNAAVVGFNCTATIVINSFLAIQVSFLFCFRFGPSYCLLRFGEN
jgi:MFS family permease